MTPKNILGAWGANLPDDLYARALAALGALQSTGTAQHAQKRDPSQLAESLREEFAAGERTALWRGALGNAVAAFWGEVVHTNPAMLAEAWRLYTERMPHPRLQPRMAVPLDWRHRKDVFDLGELRKWLEHPAVELGSLTFEVSRPRTQRVGWHWPLRVGVLADPGRALLADAMDRAEAQHGWIRNLTRRFTLGNARDACDLLVVTSLDGAALRTARRMRASFVACLADPPADLALAADGYGILSANLAVAGVGWVGRLDAPQTIADWFEAIVREVSHDIPIATTMSMAGLRCFNRLPMIVGSGRALDMCRILAIADRQDRIVVALGGSRSSSGGGGVEASTEPVFGGDADAAPPVPPRRLFGNLADQMRHREFVAESVDGVRAVYEFGNRETLLDQVRGRRWIQARGWRLDAPLHEARSFVERRWNLLIVHIGPLQVSRSDASFPERGVDFSHGDVPLTVQLELAGADLVAVRPQELTLGIEEVNARGGPVPAVLQLLAQRDLPAESDGQSPPTGLAASSILLPVVGNSSAALFGVCPQRGVTITGRIAIIHANRVLQTAKLWIETSGAADDGRGVVVEVDEPIHPRDDDLEERRKYDVSIGVSDVGGKLHLAVQSDEAGNPTAVELSSLQSPIAAIRKHLKTIAEEWDYAKPILDQEVFHTRAWGLAAAGTELNKHLRAFFGNDIDRWERIHLLPYTNEFLPLEYVYAGPPPKIGARVCPNVVGALRAASCGTCPNRQDNAFVCPTQFWGFQRVIERSAVPSPEERKARSAPVVPSKSPYGKVSSLLFATSNRTFNYKITEQERTQERQNLVEALEALAKGIDPAVDDWTKWRVAASKQPNLLVLLVHTDKVIDTPVLEIGNRNFLGKHEIRRDITGATRPLLLILLGCSVAGVDDDFEPYPGVFHRDAEASIVLATIAPIRGEDAVRIAKRLSAALVKQLANPEAATFGDMLPRLRRTLLSEGYPGMMGLVGFGDGDWLLGGRDAAT